MRSKFIPGMILAINLILQVCAVFALDPRKSMDFYRHNVWTVEDGLPMNSVISIAQTPDGYLWLGTETGLARFDGIDFDVFNHENTPALLNDLILSLQADRKGVLWIGTYGGGICVLKNGNDHFSYFNNRHGLSSNVIYTFYEDREGTLWIGTEGGGLNSLGDTRITTYTMKHGLSYDIITAIFQDNRGNIWIGNMGSGVDYLNAENGKFQSITTRDGLSANAVFSITQHPDGCLWFGTVGGGVNRLTLKTRQFDVFTIREGLSDNFVRALYVGPSGNLWAGTDNGGVHRFSNGWFILYDNVGFRVNTIFKDSKGNLWAGTWGNGLCLLKDGKIDVFNKERGLSDGIVISIYEDNEGVLWIGTYSGGLNRLQGGKLAGIGKKDGPPDNTIYCILEDQKHYLWMSSNHGIFCVKRKELEDLLEGKIERISPSLFTTEDGMKSIECNGGHQPAGWQTQDGKLWFPTTKGVSVVDPENIGINTLPPPVQIKKVIIDGISYDVGKKAVVPPGSGNLEIHYTGLSFVVPTKTLFRYKIEGLEEKWRDAGTGRTVNYIGVPPGSYRFRVIACNSDGVWNNTGAYFDFNIKSRFYQTTAFKIGFPLGVILIFYCLYYSFKKYLSLRKLRGKYKGSSLTPKEAMACLQKILHVIEVEKVYKDADISLNSLAEKLCLSPRNLSQIINEQMGKNFYELINNYRVKEAQRILISPQTSHMSILDIGYEVGFSSKSAFNRAFKHFTNMTPSQFK